MFPKIYTIFNTSLIILKAKNQAVKYLAKYKHSAYHKEKNWQRWNRLANLNVILQPLLKHVLAVLIKKKHGKGMHKTFM